MSRRKESFTGQFAGRLVEMMESPAYRELSLSALRFIHRLEIEHAHHAGKENGRLACTFNDLEEYGIHRHAIAPAIRESVALGFAAITEQGRAGNAEFRAPSRYRLTFRPAKGYPGDGSHEWRRIKTCEEAKLLAAAARKAKPEKTKSQCRKAPDFGGENHHRKQNVLGTESATTGLSAETTTTIYISGREDAA